MPVALAPTAGGAAWLIRNAPFRSAFRIVPPDLLLYWPLLRHSTACLIVGTVAA